MTALPNTQQSIYDEVISFTHNYFGPEGPVHINRIIAAHLRKRPELLSGEELVSLLDWIRAAALFLAEDKERVEEYINDLMTLTAE